MCMCVYVCECKREKSERGKREPTVSSSGLGRIGRGEMGALVGRGVDHQQEALLGGRELRDVVVWVGTADVLLHGAIAFFLEALARSFGRRTEATYTQASLATIGTVIVLQGADDLVVGVGDGEGAGQRGAGWHVQS